MGNADQDMIFSNAIEEFQAEDSLIAFNNFTTAVGQMADRNRWSSMLPSNDQSFVTYKVDELFEELRKEPVIDKASDPFLYFGIGVRNLVRINSQFTCLFLALAILASF